MTVIGGAGSLSDIEKVIDKHGVIGVAAGSLFVFRGPYKAVLISYPTQLEKNKIFNINKL
jgi:cyclase